MRHIYEKTHTLFAPDNFAAQKTLKALFAVIYLWESFFELSTVLLTTLSVSSLVSPRLLKSGKNYLSIFFLLLWKAVVC